MSRRHLKLVLVPMALVAALCISACGTQRIGVAKQSNQTAGGDLYHGAVLFSERCAGCHTLSYAGTHGSAANIRVAQGNSGPDFDQRCERPIARVLYAIENGGFSGAYMPQNVVVGPQAVEVAKFVATFAGRHVPHQAGVVACQKQPIGTLPPGSGTVNAGKSAAASAGGSP